MVSIYGDFSERQVGQLNLLELFARAVKDYQKYEILQVVRVFRGDAPYRAAIWFSYIEKEKVLPLTAQK
jgi:hypothetical protein